MSDPIQSRILAGATTTTTTNNNSHHDNSHHDNYDDHLSFRSSRTGGSGTSSSLSSRQDQIDKLDGSMAVYQPLWVRLACILLDFLTQTYDQIRIVPEIVLFERWLCESSFPGQGHSHELCKSPDIQYELARLRSWKAFFDGVAILLTAVPMGLLADRIGRKKVIASSILGPLLSLCWTVGVCKSCT